MFKRGDLILYGNTGVCRVKDIGTKDMPGAVKNQLYYTLEPLYQAGVIYTPVDCKVFMRPIISKDEANRLIDTIPAQEAEIFHSRVLSELSTHYEDCLKTHDCADLIEMTKSLYAKKQSVLSQKRKFGAVDDRFMRRAEDLLFGELAAALGIERGEVTSYISTRIGNEDYQSGVI
jgi:CarD family transcriptional regulator